VIYGNFPVGSPERKALLGKVAELLPALESFPDKKSKDAFRLKRQKTLDYIRTAPDIGVDIVLGNAKIGAISQFSLPAGQNFRGASCPGATELCESLCYAKKSLFQFHEHKYFVNWAYALLFPERFLKVWSGAALSGVVRIHVGGDYFSPDYVRLWSDIIQNREEIRFYAYTRSWQDGHGKLRKEFLGPLRKLSELQNMRLVLSCDRETGIPPVELIPAAIRAWLAENDKDLPAEPLELIFRDHAGMEARPVSELAGTPVCPVERSKEYKKISGKITCQNCTFCYSTGHLMYDRRDDNPSLFNSFAGTNVEKRVAGMFRGAGSGPSMGGSDSGSRDCSCGAFALCSGCELCALCRCRC
jgi:hypothetical protein